MAVMTSSRWLVFLLSVLGLVVVVVDSYCERLEVTGTRFSHLSAGVYTVLPDDVWCEVGVLPAYKQDEGNFVIFNAKLTEFGHEVWAGWVVGEVLCDPTTFSIRAKSDEVAPNIVNATNWKEQESGVEYQTGLTVTCQECERGYWGDTCLNECLSCNHGNCDDNDGHCVCSLGYGGVSCSEFTTALILVISACCLVTVVSAIILIIYVFRKKNLSLGHQKTGTVVPQPGHRRNKKRTKTPRAEHRV